MKREDAERLLHHHYRLHTQIQSKIDNKPPKSMFISPKSSHYKPFANRKIRSLETTPNPPRRPRGQEELARFLTRKQITSNATSLNSSFNAYARKSMSNLTSAASSRPSTSKITKPIIDKNSVRAKILDTKTYYPPTRRPRAVPRHFDVEVLSRSMTALSLNRQIPQPRELVQRLIRARTASAIGMNRQAAVKQREQTKENMELYKNAQKYKDFKDSVLNDILRRGIFTDRIIKDAFYREIEKRTDLDLNQMELIMFETLTELGVKTAEGLQAPPPSRALRPQTALPRKVALKNVADHVDLQKSATVDFMEPEAERLSIVDDENGSQMSSLSSRSSTRTSSASTAASKASEKAENIGNSEASSTENSSSEASTASSTNSSKKSTPRSDSSPSVFSISIPPPVRLSPSSSDMEEYAKRRFSYRLNEGERKYSREMSIDRFDSPVAIV